MCYFKDQYVIEALCNPKKPLDSDVHLQPNKCSITTGCEAVTGFACNMSSIAQETSTWRCYNFLLEEGLEKLCEAKNADFLNNWGYFINRGEGGWGEGKWMREAGELRGGESEQMNIISSLSQPHLYHLFFAEIFIFLSRRTFFLAPFNKISWKDAL